MGLGIGRSNMYRQPPNSVDSGHRFGRGVPSCWVAGCSNSPTAAAHDRPHHAPSPTAGPSKQGPNKHLPRYTRRALAARSSHHTPTHTTTGATEATGFAHCGRIDRPTGRGRPGRRASGNAHNSLSFTRTAGELIEGKGGVRRFERAGRLKGRALRYPSPFGTDSAPAANCARGWACGWVPRSNGAGRSIGRRVETGGARMYV